MVKLTSTNVVLKDKSNNNYSFSIHSFEDEFKDESGIYAFSKREKNSTEGFTHTILYIGMAESFKKRFSSHHKEECATKKGANCILLMPTPAQKERERIEKELIRFYKPSCNEVHV